MVAGAIVGMGIMQAIVSCTLSMLLRHTKRIVVIGKNFFEIARGKESREFSLNNKFFLISSGRLLLPFLSTVGTLHLETDPRR